MSEKKIEIREADFERLVNSVDALTKAIKMLVDAQMCASHPVFVYPAQPLPPTVTILSDQKSSQGIN